MPIMLDARHYDLWLDWQMQSPAALAPLLRPFSPEHMTTFPVSPWVNDVRHKGARCLEPAA
jgi:putative SOS response-associated peptidase YedK